MAGGMLAALRAGTSTASWPRTHSATMPAIPMVMPMLVISQFSTMKKRTMSKRVAPSVRRVPICLLRVRVLDFRPRRCVPGPFVINPGYGVGRDRRPGAAHFVLGSGQFHLGQCDGLPAHDLGFARPDLLALEFCAKKIGRSRWSCCQACSCSINESVYTREAKKGHSRPFEERTE